MHKWRLSNFKRRDCHGMELHAPLLPLVAHKLLMKHIYISYNSNVGDMLA